MLVIATSGVPRTNCMACHATHERLMIWPALAFHGSVGRCRVCHHEHLGVNAPKRQMYDLALATTELGLLSSG